MKPSVPLHAAWQQRALQLDGTSCRVVVLVGGPCWGGDGVLEQWADLAAQQGKSVVRVADGVPVHSADLVLVDHTPADWNPLLHYAAAHPESRVVVSSMEEPPAVEVGLVHVVAEDFLGLTFTEVQEVVHAAFPQVLPDQLRALWRDSRGCMTIINRQLDIWHASKGTVAWSSPGVPLAAGIFLDLTVDQPHPGHDADSFQAALHHAIGLRQFTAQDVAAACGISLAAARRHVERLRLWPGTTETVDLHSGEPALQWQEPIWYRLNTAPGAQQRAQDALSVARLHDNPLMELYYLLQLEQYERADQLVFQRLRIFLLMSDSLTDSALAVPSISQLRAYPSLLTLRGELLLRLRGDAASAREFFQFALGQYQRHWQHHNSTSRALERFRLLVRIAFTSAGVGSRAGVSRALEMVDLLLQQDGPDGVSAEVRQDPAVSAIVSAESYLAFWAAIQTDRHHAAMRYAALMESAANPLSPTAEYERFTAQTERIFLEGGAAQSGETGPELPRHTDPLLLIEHDQDQQALELVASLAERTRNGPTRSAADALVMVVQTLTGSTPTAADILRVVDRSSEFWEDGHASTFICAAATMAFLARKNLPAARAVLARAASSDGFTTLACALTALYAGDTDTALAVLEPAPHNLSSPRGRYVASALRAAALNRTGNTAAALTHLSQLWLPTRAGLLRFALRFVPQQDLSELTAAAGPETPQAVRALLEQSARVHHPFSPILHAPLTRTEHELIPLLRRGLTNEQIAHERFVSPNTIKTQMRSLLAKLGATNRAQALEILEEIEF